MAFYRLETKIISRGKGRSIVAAAAYRSGEVLRDARTGVVHDYVRRNGVLFTGIFAPKDVPAWMTDRAALWNHVEAVEKRVDARLAREYLISLPHELNEEQRFRLVRDFVRERFVRRGLIADVAIHAPSHDGDDRNFHAHILVCERQAGAEGFARMKFTAINSKTDLIQTRRHWAKACNRALAQAGLSARVDHRPTRQGLFRAWARCLTVPVSRHAERYHTHKNQEVRGVTPQRRQYHQIRSLSAKVPHSSFGPNYRDIWHLFKLHKA